MNPRGGFIHPTPLAGEPLRPLGYFCIHDLVWRREWDSNPRTLARRRFSRPVPSTTRTSLHLEERNVRLSNTCDIITWVFPLVNCSPEKNYKKVFSKNFEKRLAIQGNPCYYKQADSREHSKQPNPGVAQLVARLTGGQEAVSSSLATRTTKKVTTFVVTFFVGCDSKSCLAPIDD